MYVAVKGGEAAIAAAHAWLAEERRGDPGVPEILADQVEAQLALAVDRVMAEASCHDPGLAALAVKQARGDLIEAVFLLRAYRTTLPRFGACAPLETGRMRLWRRISATHKDLPGGQLLGPTFDYAHRLLDFGLSGEGGTPPAAPEAEPEAGAVPRLTDLLAAEGVLPPEAPSDEEPGDLTREPLAFPASRALRLQNLARADEGFLLGLAYSTQRGYGNSHPFVGELRQGEVSVGFSPAELGFELDLGDLVVTECQTVNQFRGGRGEPPGFTRGYGLVLGRVERRAIAMALVDRALRAAELGEEAGAPAQDEEFVLSHSDNVEATGFLEHLKLPHHVDFQSELEAVRGLRDEVPRDEVPREEVPRDGQREAAA